MSMQTKMVDGILTAAAASYDASAAGASSAAVMPVTAGPALAGPFGPGAWVMTTTEVNVVAVGVNYAGSGDGTGDDPLFGGSGMDFQADGSSLEDTGNYAGDGSGHTASGIDSATPDVAPRVDSATALQGGNTAAALQDMNYAIQNTDALLAKEGPLVVPGNAAIGFAELGAITITGVLGGFGLVTAGAGIGLGFLAGATLPAVQAAAIPMLSSSASLLGSWVASSGSLTNDERAAVNDMQGAINAVANTIYGRYAGGSGLTTPSGFNPDMAGAANVFEPVSSSQLAKAAAYFHQGYAPGVINYLATNAHS